MKFLSLSVPLLTLTLAAFTSSAHAQPAAPTTEQDLKKWFDANATLLGLGKLVPCSTFMPPIPKSTVDTKSNKSVQEQLNLDFQTLIQSEPIICSKTSATAKTMQDKFIQSDKSNKIVMMNFGELDISLDNFSSIIATESFDHILISRNSKGNTFIRSESNIFNYSMAYLDFISSSPLPLNYNRISFQRVGSFYKNFFSRNGVLQKDNEMKVISCLSPMINKTYRLSSIALKDCQARFGPNGVQLYIEDRSGQKYLNNLGTIIPKKISLKPF
jgi:hypothetical protein